MKNILLIILTLSIMTACDPSNIPTDHDNQDPVLQDQVEDTEIEESEEEEMAAEEENEDDTEEAMETNATIKTSMGEIKVELYADKAPETVKNFVTLAKEGKYDGTPFHRVIKDFMIQTGDFENQNGTGGHSYKGPGTQLLDEFGEGLVHEYGTLSMANAGPNTGGSQFFIVQAKEGTPWLNGGHAIFGKVTEGMNVVDDIANVETTGPDRPVEPILIEGISF